MIPEMTAQRHIVTLRKRLAWLTKRIGDISNTRSPSSCFHDLHEAAAIKWALSILDPNPPAPGNER